MEEDLLKIATNFNRSGRIPSFNSSEQSTRLSMKLSNIVKSSILALSQQVSFLHHSVTFNVNHLDGLPKTK